MKFDTKSDALLDCELAYKKILEGTEFRSNEAFLKDVPEEFQTSAWIGHASSVEASHVPLK